MTSLMVSAGHRIQSSRRGSCPARSPHWGRWPYPGVERAGHTGRPGWSTPRPRWRCQEKSRSSPLPPLAVLDTELPQVTIVTHSGGLGQSAGLRTWRWGGGHREDKGPAEEDQEQHSEDNLGEESTGPRSSQSKKYIFLPYLVLHVIKCPYCNTVFRDLDTINVNVLYFTVFFIILLLYLLLFTTPGQKHLFCFHNSVPSPVRTLTLS